MDNQELQAVKPRVDEQQALTLSRQLGESQTLQRRRRLALASYAAADLPDRVRHLWRYSDPAELLPKKPLRLDLPGSPSLDVLPPVQGAVVRLAPGRFPAVGLSREALQARIQISPLQATLAESERLGTALPSDHGLFEALNGAAWTIGAVVAVPPRVTLEGPILLELEAEPGASWLPRVLVSVGEGAVVNVVERHHGGGQDSVVVGVSELFVADRARLTWVVVQEWEPKVRGHLTERVVVGSQAELQTVLTCVGGEQLKLDLGATLAGPGARSELIGFGLGGRRQHFDLHTEHRHQASDTWSHMDVKVALMDRAHAAYTGLIRIEQEAPRSEAYQEERNLLLSPKARADAIPELEILNREVRCTHGATTTPVDDEQLFYLRSRGIAAPEGRRLIIRGFFEGALQRLPAGLRREMEEKVEARLRRHEEGGL